MVKKGIIYETLNEVKSLGREVREDGLMHLKGVFGVCGVRNNNQRVYEANNYKKMVESMQERLKKAPIPGELEHPASMNITLENISHRIDSIEIDENGVVSGEITLLNTPKGRVAREIVEGGLQLFISSRAQGQVDRNGNVTLEMLQTYDLVGSPGFSQAELHLNENQCFENICEGMCIIGEEVDENANNQNTNEDMDAEALKQIQEQVEDLKNQVEYLTEQNNLLQEQVDERQDFNLKELADGIQNWITEQYSPTLQKWIVEEYSQKIQDWVVENYSEEVQNWVVEHFAPQIQGWLMEHYNVEVQNWVTEEFGKDMKKWITENYSEKLQSWLNEHFEPEMKQQISETLKKEVDEAKNSKLTMVDSILEMLEHKQVEKPGYGRKANMVVENNTPNFIAEMPADIRVKYDLASQEIKESIDRKAKIYDWSKPNAIELFWESIDFDAKPSPSVNEDLNKFTDERERAIRESIRRWRNR
jgi:hypothetical protein